MSHSELDMLHENSSTFASDMSANVFITIEFSFAAGRCDCLSIIYCKLRPRKSKCNSRANGMRNKSKFCSPENPLKFQSSRISTWGLLQLPRWLRLLGGSQGPGVNSKRTLKWMARRGWKSFLYDFNPFGENLIFLSRSASTLRWINFAPERWSFVFFFPEPEGLGN